MNKDFRNIFTTVIDEKELIFIGEGKQDRWEEGHLQTQEGTVVARVVNGIPRFVEDKDDLWGNEEDVEEQLKNSGYEGKEALINRNWNTAVKQWNCMHVRYDWINKIIKHDGIILEVACGPGGGNMPYILQANPEAHLLSNDIGWWVVNEWKKFYDKKSIKNIGFAQFDMTKCPIKSNTIDAVTSSGGFGNISNTHLALKEAFRILKPNGKLYMLDSDLDMEVFNKLPISEKEEWIKHQPITGNGFVNCLKDIGFKIIQ
jgi:SAM-dependent methyltransferase